ncbi:MAG: flagellar basal body rod protein FlgB [Planctomycetota bacterium]|jgi:flagellar basal-body rod protein FlgB
MSNQINIVDLLESAIRAESLRQKAIANNIANIETPRYRRIDVKFKELLAKAIESPGSIDLKDLQAELYEPQNTPVNANGNDVNFESEMGDMIKNSLRHEAYVRLLNKKYKQIELAISMR